MRLKFKSTLLLIIILSAIANASVTKENLFFRAIRMKDGLPGSTVMTIEQDRLGFIWLGTNDGLCRFDGTHFKIYKHEPDNPQSLSGNFVQNLHLDNRGNLWVMTASGMNYFDLHQNKINRITADGSEGTIVDNSPSDIKETGDGTLFIASYYSGISFKKNNEKTYHYLNTIQNKRTKLSSNKVNCLELISDSLLFIGYRDKGIDIYNIPKNQTQSISKKTGQSLSSVFVNAICKDDDKGVWIGTLYGLSYYDLTENKLHNFDYQKQKFPFITDNDIVSLFLDKSDCLWIGTRKNGLVVVHRDEILQKGEKASFAHYRQKFQPGSLSYRTVLSVFQDRDEKLWVGTHGGGVNFVENKTQRINHLKHEPGENNTLSYDKVWGMTEDHKGEIWLGTDGDGVNLWSPEKGVVRNFRFNPEDPHSISDNAIICAKTDFQGQVWLGTYEGGLNRYNPVSDRFHHYKAPLQLPNNDIRCIYEDKHKNLWVGMNGGGIAKYNREKDLFETEKLLSDYDIRSICDDADTLWLGTFSEGLLKFIPDTKKLEIYYPDTTDSNSLSSATIFSLYKTDDDYLWLGTKYGGLCRFNTKTETFDIFDEKDGLSNNTVHSILADNDKNLWLSTNNGISKFNIPNNIFTNYYWSVGVQTGEFHNGSGIVTSDGLFCFGGINGVNYFRPKNLIISAKPSNIQFIGIKILNEDIVAGSSNVIDKSIEFRPEINLNYKHSVFTIEFQSVHYPISSDTYYEYILDGYDQSWNQSEKQNSATYRNLPAGDYVFKVRTYRNQGLADSNEATLTIHVLPPYWKTKWAYLFYIVSIVLIVIIGFRFRLKQYKIKNRLVYEQKLRNKEKKLHNERLEFFTNISHELRTPLTLISAALEDLSLLKSGNLKTKKSIETAVRNSNRLMDLINQLLEFRKAEKGVSNIVAKKINLNVFIPDFLQGFREMARNKGVILKVSSTINDVFLWIDSGKFSMILNNLLSNAFKHSSSGGHITLSIEESDLQIIIKVEDNGDGIPKQIQPKIFNRYFKQDNESSSTGIGLALTKSLVKLHHGEIHVDSELGKGSCFTLRFKKGNNHFSSKQLRQKEEGNNAKSKDFVENEQEFSLTIDKNAPKIILLIDDNEEILDLLDDKLKCDFKIIKALDGSQGMSLARKCSPDLIISDIMMPGISGTEVCAQLKNDPLTSHIPIILLTAKGTEEDEIKGLDIGADDYISKPFKMSILKARVKTIIENRIKLNNYFAGLSQSKPENYPAEHDKEMLFLQKMEDYILENCINSDVSVFDLASELGFSRTTLYRKIKSLTGLSINAFVRSVKIKKSASLISEGMNVSEAAYNSGFNDLKYFRESFKKQYGRNPSEFK